MFFWLFSFPAFNIFVFFGFLTFLSIQATESLAAVLIREAKLRKNEDKQRKKAKQEDKRRRRNGEKEEEDNTELGERLRGRGRRRNGGERKEGGLGATTQVGSRSGA